MAGDLGCADSELRSFGTTRWTLVQEAAVSGETQVASAALEELCRMYWRPVYAFVRGQGIEMHDAQDLTQGFFARFIASRSYARAHREKGRFRSFLLGALKNFLADERDRLRTQKRGNGTLPVQLTDAAIAEAEVIAAREPQGNADLLYAREWAATVLHRALQRLADECEIAGKAELFGALKSHLATASQTPVAYGEIAVRLHRPVATLRSDVSRLRVRYRAILREEVRATVCDSADVDEELRLLHAAIAGS